MILDLDEIWFISLFNRVSVIISRSRISERGGGRGGPAADDNTSGDTVYNTFNRLSV